jgi:hypothetical protein
MLHVVSHLLVPKDYVHNKVLEGKEGEWLYYSHLSPYKVCMGQKNCIFGYTTVTAHMLHVLALHVGCSKIS